MKPENQNSNITLLSNKTTNTRQDSRNKAMDIINSQLNIYKTEIKGVTNCMPLYDFEKCIYINEIYDLCATLPDNKRFKPNRQAILDQLDVNHIGTMIACDKQLELSDLINVMQNTDTIANIGEKLVALHDFYISSSHMPLHYILEGSKRPVLTDEWVFAHKEREFVKLLKKIDSLRKKNKLQYELLGDGEKMCDYMRPCLAKILAYQCKKMYDSNLTEINTEKKLMFHKRLKKSGAEPTDTPDMTKDYRLVFPLLYTNKTAIRYNIAPPKRNTQHTSHLSTLRKIAPDFMKITDARSLVEYKNKIKQMAYNSQYRKDVMRDGGRSFYGSQNSLDQRYDHRNRL